MSSIPPAASPNESPGGPGQSGVPAPSHSLDPVEHLYAQLGEAAFARLIHAFYRRVRSDDLLGPMYPADDWDGAEARLRDFLIQRCGGPTRYSEQRGHPRLRARHMPFAIDSTARDRWMRLMDEALAESALPVEAVGVLRPFLDQVATFMVNR